MSTGSFENWAGNIADIGAIYPFEGATPLWVIATVIFWLVWQISMIVIEQIRFYDQVKQHSADKLKRMIE